MEKKEIKRSELIDETIGFYNYMHLCLEWNMKDYQKKSSKANNRKMLKKWEKNLRETHFKSYRICQGRKNQYPEQCEELKETTIAYKNDLIEFILKLKQDERNFKLRGKENERKTLKEF